MVSQLLSIVTDNANYLSGLSKPLEIVKRQVPVEVPSMMVGGEIVPFTGGGPGGKTAKRNAQPQRRQVPVEVPSMKVGGVIVPFSAGGPKNNA